MKRRWPGVGRRSQHKVIAEALAGYLTLDWPEAVHAAVKGYEGSGRSCRFVWRTSLATMATLGMLPGLAHWSARYVLYVGRSDAGFTAIQLRRRWNAFTRDVREVWRTPLDTAVVTKRTFGHYSVVVFGGHPVWIVTSEVESLVGGRD